MTNSGFRKGTLGFLVIILVAIWIRNLLLLAPTPAVENTVRASGGPTQVTIAADRHLEDTVFSLDRNIRDPFLMPRSPVPKSSVRNTPLESPRPVESIRAALMGQIFNARTSYVVVYDSATAITGLYRTGDSLNGFVLIKITRSSIHWNSQRGRRVVWKTNS